MCLAGGMLVVQSFAFCPMNCLGWRSILLLAMSASCLVALSLLVFVADLRKFDTAVCKESAGLLTLVLVSGAFRFICFGVSGVLEGICIILHTCFYFRIDLGGKSKRGNRHVCTNRGAICLRKEMTIG